MANRLKFHYNCFILFFYQALIFAGLRPTTIEMHCSHGMSLVHEHRSRSRPFVGGAKDVLSEFT